VSLGVAVFWGGATSASLFIGEALSVPLEQRDDITGLIMGFGAGTLLSAVAYELVPQSSLSHAFGIGIAFLVGAVTYFVADRVIDRAGGGDRQDIGGDEAEGGSGVAMFLGALLDGIPEAFILGITVAAGTGVSVAFVAAVFLSNVPQGVAGTSALRKAGATRRHITRMWSALTIACAATAGIGYLAAQHAQLPGLYSEAFAGGAVLTMLADSMMPEAFENGGRLVGLVTVLGYLLTAVLSVWS
jgi:ZIP family zinc transporter